ncbi:hypothetical protein PAMA_013622 [Pampus argenteus]
MSDVCDTFGCLFTVFLCLFVIVWSPVEGWSKVIGSTQPIVAAPGDDVILPCHLVPEVNIQSQTVEWSRPDLKPNLKPDPSDWLSWATYVHVYRDRREVPDMKIRTYVGRTEMFTDELIRGNVSLKITNVTLADGGTYRCFIPKLESRLKSATVELVVVPNSGKTWTTETPRNHRTPDPKAETDDNGGVSSKNTLISAAVIVCILLMFGGVVAAHFIKQRCQKPNHLKYDHALSNASV